MSAGKPGQAPPQARHAGDLWEMDKIQTEGRPPVASSQFQFRKKRNFPHEKQVDEILTAFANWPRIWRAGGIFSI